MLNARAIGSLSEDLPCVGDVLGESAREEKTIRTRRACAPRHVDQLETAGSSDVGLRASGRILNCGRDGSPALIEAEDTTIVVEPEWTFRVGEYIDGIMEYARRGEGDASSAGASDRTPTTSTV